MLRPLPGRFIQRYATPALTGPARERKRFVKRPRRRYGSERNEPQKTAVVTCGNDGRGRDANGPLIVLAEQEGPLIEEEAPAAEEAIAAQGEALTEEVKAAGRAIASEAETNACHWPRSVCHQIAVA
jgi:hypothetical protein